MRAFVFFLVSVLLAACARPPVAPPSIPSHEADAATLTQKTVALVTLNDEGEQRAFCTGVWVSATSILTAAHCVADEELSAHVTYAVPADVLSADHGQRTIYAPHGAVVYAKDEAHDLALLRAIAPPPHLTASINDAPIAPGQFCQAMGHSIGMLVWSYSSGDIAAVRKLDIGIGEDLTWIQSTAPISPGNSGGGLFDAKGDLIGITSASFRRGQQLNIFVHRMHLAAFLRSQTERTSL
jgi:S1-C subfamily serine protease